MKIIKLSVLLVIAVFLAGCADCIPLSLHPLFPEKDARYDPALVGKWVDKESGEQLIIKKAEGTGYLMTFEGEDSPPEKFHAQLGRLGDFLFLDLVLVPEFNCDKENVYSLFHWIPGHSFSKAKITNDTLQLTLLNEDWLEKKMLAKEVTLAHEYIDEQMVLTAPTAELQAFVKKYGADEEAFPTDKEDSPAPMEWQRQKE